MHVWWTLGSGLPALHLLLLLRFSGALYLPGIAPIEYQNGAQVDVKVNKLTSVKTQLPYDYYTLPFCRPEKIQRSVENLGEILTGDQIENTPYEIAIPKTESCKTLCKKTLTKAEKERVKTMIDEDYQVNLMVDNLPAATYVRGVGSQEQAHYYTDGFPVGVSQNGQYYVHNHLHLHLLYHKQPDEFEGYRIVGFEVDPRSTTQEFGQDQNVASRCDAVGPFDLEKDSAITFTYDVQWDESPIRWASRWDSYLKMTGGQIHWFAILNSVVVVLFLSGMVAMVLLRTLYRDITKYNELASAEEAAEETGWKLVHGDVFRKPKHFSILCVSVASGFQILAMTVVTLLFALLGFLSPAHRGGLLQTTLILFTFMGMIAGYCAARMCKLFDCDDWKLTTFLTAFMYPALFFFIFFVLNLFIWGQKSSGAVPFTTMFALIALWFGISMPLVYLGSYIGIRQPSIELPVRTNQVPRAVPEQPWWQREGPAFLVGGLLPFGAIFTELFFIMSSIWQHQFYYLFGFLALVLAILILTCAEISIALTYFQLTQEDYCWWERSFLTSGFSAVYVFLYSGLYFSSRLQIEKTISIMLYFGYMFILSTCFFLLTGSIGFISSFFFVKAIYGSIKVD